MENVESKKLENFAEVLSDGEESDSFLHEKHSDHGMEREFRNFCEKESSARCDKINRSTAISVSDAYRQTCSERLRAVAALPYSTFRTLQGDEEFPKLEIIRTIRCATYRVYIKRSVGRNQTTMTIYLQRREYQNSLFPKCGTCQEANL